MARHFSNVLPMLLALSALAACGTADDANPASELFGIPFTSSRVVTGNELRRASDRLAAIGPVESRFDLESDPVFAVSHAWGSGQASASLVGVSVEPETRIHRAVVITDRIPDDDSVSSFRYDIKLIVKNKRWRILELRESWRCWDDRGHQDFSIEPCN